VAVGGEPDGGAKDEVADAVGGDDTPMWSCWCGGCPEKDGEEEGDEGIDEDR
jgi:hypothetical protein